MATPETPAVCIAAYVTVRPPMRSTTPPVTPRGPPMPTFYGALMTSLLFADGGRLPEWKNKKISCSYFSKSAILNLEAPSNQPHPPPT